jgi:KipI family sensor histidine kinase inhibitor
MTSQAEISYPRIIRSGDRAVSIEFSDQISETANLQVLALNAFITADPLSGVLEAVPTYRSLTLIYDPYVIRGSVIAEELMRRAASGETAQLSGRLYEFPVLYGGEHQADLDELAAMKTMPVSEVIRLHIEAEYRVYMIGFAPGFAYLGGLPEILHTPRLAVPRQRVEAGAIGIGGKQSSINSVPGPSGWRFLGRTPFKLFDPARRDPFALKAGDRIRFRQIDADEAADLDERVSRGNFDVPGVA